MHFNKVLSTFSLALLSLGPLNSLPVYAMEDPEAPQGCRIKNFVS